MDDNTVAALKDSLSSATNKSHFFVSVSGLPDDSFAVLEYQSSDYTISNDYTFHVDTLGRDVIAPKELIGKKAILTTLQGDESRYIHGIVTGMQHIRSLLDAEEHVLVIQSPITVLKHFSHNRVFINKSIKAIVDDVLLGAGLTAADYSFETRFEYPQHEFLVQYDESDFNFLQRMLALHGIFYRFEQTADQAVLVFYDNSEDLPSIKGNSSLDYILETGTVRNHETISGLLKQSQLLTQHVQLKDYNYRTPEAELINHQKNTTQIAGSGSRYSYGDHYLSLDAGEQQTKIEQQSIDWQRSTYTIETDCRAVAPGTTLSVSGHPVEDRNTDYLIIEVLEMLGNQRAAQLIHAGNKDSGKVNQNRTFFAKLRAIKVGLPYRTPTISRPYVNGSFTAIIESTGGEYAYLDEQGRYKIRFDFDSGDAPIGDASHPVRLAQAYTGTDFGIHFPLHKNSEVLVSCVNGDINRPIILGTVPNPETPSPVTSKNNSENILRSFGGNELIMDDTIDAQKIELFTKDKKNQLLLDAQKGAHKVKLASLEGDMTLKAGNIMVTESDDSQYLNVGNNHAITVEKRHRLMTKNKAITQVAGTDLIKTAEKNVQWNSDTENTEIVVGKDMVIEVEENCSFEVKNNDMHFKVTNGNFEIEAAKAITLIGTGRGTITLKQAGGKIVFDKSGKIDIEGPTVNIDANSINIKGGMLNHNPGGGAGGAGATAAGLSGAGGSGSSLIDALVKNYERTGSNSTESNVEQLETDAKAKAEKIAAAQQNKPLSPKDPQVVSSAWAKSRIEVGTPILMAFTVMNFKGGEAVTIKIYEYDNNGMKDLVDTIKAKLKIGTGQCKATWQRSQQQANQDLQDDQDAGDTGPLEYRFEVEVEGSKGNKTSGPLNLTATVIYEPESDTGQQFTEGKEFELETADGKVLKAKVEDGKITFKNAIVGPLELFTTTTI